MVNYQWLSSGFSDLLKHVLLTNGLLSVVI
jgi:hypothetical protein